MKAWPLIVAVAASCAGKPKMPPEPPGPFISRGVMIPMRDGVQLQTVLWIPREAKAPLPFLIDRTPYGVPPPGMEKQPIPEGAYQDLARDGYIFVWQNIRGRFHSGGTFVMNRPPRDKSDPKSVDESTDAYDTIDWLVKNIPNNNGRAGILGTSYDGWTATMALVEPHPALKAICEQASVADMFLGDDFHHNGAFRLYYAFAYAAGLETDSDKVTTFDFGMADNYDWFLQLGPLSNAQKRLGIHPLPTWTNFMTHPNLDAFWRKQQVVSMVEAPSVPILHVAGWWDQEDFYGPLAIYEKLERRDEQHRNYLLVGPWNHGGWWGKGRALGPIDFGADTAAKFGELQARWFAHFLHDRGAIDLPEATIFETGTNRWRSFDAWPPKNAHPRKLYFHANGRLDFASPSDEGHDEYVSDPAHPVPFRPRPIPGLFDAKKKWTEWLIEDQRFVDGRPDVATWSTEPLKENVTIAGDIVADLFASTSGHDADWFVKLIDVLPDGPPPPAPKEKTDKPPPDLRGYQLIIADEILRARFRDDFAKPKPLTPGQVVEYRIDLHTNAHTFQKGHRIMVQVQSTLFPLIDRNPQSWVESIYQAKASDYVKATQRIHRSPAHPSAIILPVLPPN